MMTARRTLLTIALLSALAAGWKVHAQEGAATAPAPAAENAAPAPGATTGLPFINDGANQPVLQTISPEGAPVIDPAAAANAIPAPQDGHAAEGEHGKRKGLPQFDATTFPRQIFWLVIVFAFLYVVYSRKTLPAISAVLENRRERVSSDLRAAEDLKKQVEQVRAEYEAAIASAQSEAQKLIMNIQTDIKKTAEEQDAAFKAKADAATRALESKIDVQRTRIMSELGSLAADLTVDIAHKVAGVHADRGAARDIIEGMNGKQKAA